MMFGTSTVTLKRGDRGPSVTYLQQALGQAGFPVTVDGAFGPETENAVKTFQAAHGLMALGQTTDATWAALGVPSPTGSRSDYTTPSNVIVMPELEITGAAPAIQIPTWAYFAGGGVVLAILAMVFGRKKPQPMLPAVAGYRRRR